MVGMRSMPEITRARLTAKVTVGRLVAFMGHASKNSGNGPSPRFRRTASASAPRLREGLSRLHKRPDDGRGSPIDATAGGNNASRHALVSRLGLITATLFPAQVRLPSSPLLFLGLKTTRLPHTDRALSFGHLINLTSLLPESTRKCAEGTLGPGLDSTSAICQMDQMSPEKGS